MRRSPIDPPRFQVLPPLSSDEKERLRADIQAHGIRVPIEVDRQTGEVLDGHHRLEIAHELGIECPSRKIRLRSDAERTAYAIRVNLNRRNLSAEQKAEVRKRQIALAAELSREGLTQEQVGAALGVAQQRVSEWEAMRNTGSGKAHTEKPDCRRILTRDGKKKAAKLVKKGLTQAQAAADLGVTQPTVSRAIKKVEKEREEEEARRRKADAAKGVAQVRDMRDLDGPFQLIYADPPWRYEEATTNPRRQIERQYPTMTIEELCELPVAEIADKGAMLFMWATNPKLEEAFLVLNAWGFSYRTNLVWVKDKIGLGHYVRQQHELLLIGARGKPGTPRYEDRISSVLRAPRGRHSAKPDVAAEAIERMYPKARKVELFCRSPRPGWTVWGNEV